MLNTSHIENALASRFRTAELGRYSWNYRRPYALKEMLLLLAYIEHIYENEGNIVQDVWVSLLKLGNKEVR